MNQNVCKKLVDLVAAGHASNLTNIIITLFRAYATSTSNKFKSSVSYWKNKWNSGAIKEPEDLIGCANAKYFELRNLGTWGKRSNKDDQIVALTSCIDKLTKTKANTNSSNKKKGGNDKKNRDNNVGT